MEYIFAWINFINVRRNDRLSPTKKSLFNQNIFETEGENEAKHLNFTFLRYLEGTLISYLLLHVAKLDILIPRRTVPL